MVDGLTQVRAGLLQVNAGLTTMYDQVGGIPTQARPLFDGINALLDGIGSTSTAGTLLYGVDHVRQALDGLAIPALGEMAADVYNTDPAHPGAYQKTGCDNHPVDRSKRRDHHGEEPTLARESLPHLQ